MNVQTKKETSHTAHNQAAAQPELTSKSKFNLRKKMMKTSKQSKSKLRAVFGFLAKSVLALVILACGIFLWAYFSTDKSLVARGIMWGDSDADDLYRFPSREIAGSENPVSFKPVSEDLLSDQIITVEALDGEEMPFAEFLEQTNTTAFIVLHKDQLVYERYFNGASRDSIQTSFSAAKSFTSTLIGIALEEEFIRSLDDPITDYLPELVERDERFEDITIRNLLNMTSGLQWNRSDSNPFSDDFISYYSPDLRTAALSIEIVEQPGESYVYNDYNPLLVGMILERATGMSVSEYMETRLWKPMGAEGEGSWSLDSNMNGFEKMFAGLNGRAIDLVKLGWLFLNDGRNGNTQVLPHTWVERIGSGSDSVFTNRFEHANYYQYYWFLDVENDAYYAEGDKCQFIYVYPEADLVIARFGKDCGGYVFGLGWIIGVAEYFENLLAE